MLPLDSLVFTTGDTPAKTVHDILLEKHPPAKPLVPSAVYEPDTIPEPHPIHFDRIDGPLIRTVALKRMEQLDHQASTLQGGNVCVHLSALIQPIYVMLLPPSPKESVQPMLTPRVLIVSCPHPFRKNREGVW